MYCMDCDTESGDHYKFYFRNNMTKEKQEEFVRKECPEEFGVYKNGEEWKTIYWSWEEIKFEDD